MSNLDNNEANETQPRKGRPAGSFDAKKFAVLLGGMLVVLTVIGGAYLLLAGI